MEADLVEMEKSERFYKLVQASDLEEEDEMTEDKQQETKTLEDVMKEEFQYLGGHVKPNWVRLFIYLL
jgi:hypothetical protein